MSKYLLFLLLAVPSVVTLHAKDTRWTLLLYIQSDNSLNAAVCKNLYDLSRAQVDDTVKLLVQVQMYGDYGIRCVVEDGQIKPVAYVQLKHEPRENLKQSMQWAYASYPAQEYAIILGGHGFGVLDPIWHEADHDFRPEVMADYQPMCVIKNMACEHKKKHRGMLLDAEHHTYLSNADMVDAFAEVVRTTLNGKRLAVLGTDACKMAMLEIAYQIAPYVRYVIGSQECELVDGYDYTACGNALMQETDVLSVVRQMVQSYEDYYQAIALQYTQSGISTDAIKMVVDSMNAIIQHLLDHNADYSDILTTVREGRMQFCEQPSYVDLYDFYDTLEKILDNRDTLLSVLLAKGKEAIQLAVVANIAGQRVPHAHGLSVYYPEIYTPSSYETCAFARDTLWIRFLEIFAIGQE